MTQEDRIMMHTDNIGTFETFAVSQLEANYNAQNMDHADEYTITEPGWYWWACEPGCLPDGPAIGPFKTEQEAMDDAVHWYE